MRRSAKSNTVVSHSKSKQLLHFVFARHCLRVIEHEGSGLKVAITGPRSVTTTWGHMSECRIFTHLKLCLADAIHNFKLVKINHI